MKGIFIIICMSIMGLHAAEKNNSDKDDRKLEELIAPLMELTKDLPVTVSYANKQKYLLDPKLTSQRRKDNISVVNKKTMPWNVVGAFAFVLFIIWLIRILTPIQGRSASTSKVKIPPKEVALRALEELSKSKLIENQKYASELVSLDKIIREYVENFYHVNAPAYTTEEFLKNVEVLPFKNKLASFFETTDKVKFALYKPSKEEVEAALALTQNLINQVNH